MDFKLAFVAIVIVGAVAAGISAWSGIGFWLILPIVAAGWLINGLVIMVEDDLPGGFNNPDGSRTPHYNKKLTWTVRALILILGGITAFLLLLWKFG